MWNYGEQSPKFVKEFDNEMDQIATKNTGEERIAKANELNNHKAFRDCHPTAEHLVPYHVALGAAGEDAGKKLLNDTWSTLSWGSWSFGLPKETVLPKYDSTQQRDEL
jgi:4,5-DOPA dioxygenase extradiol